MSTDRFPGGRTTVHHRPRADSNADAVPSEEAWRAARLWVKGGTVQQPSVVTSPRVPVPSAWMSPSPVVSPVSAPSPRAGPSAWQQHVRCSAAGERAEQAVDVDVSWSGDVAHLQSVLKENKRLKEENRRLRQEGDVPTRFSSGRLGKSYQQELERLRRGAEDSARGHEQVRQESKNLQRELDKARREAEEAQTQQQLWLRETRCLKREIQRLRREGAKRDNASVSLRENRRLSQEIQRLRASQNGAAESARREARELLVEECRAELACEVRKVLGQSKGQPELAKKQLNKLKVKYHPDKNPVARWLFEELTKTLNDA